MVKVPLGLDIHNIIDDLRNYSWEASKILLYYAKILKNSENKGNIIKSKNSEDPVTLADLKVNEIIIRRINEKYKNINWKILSEENSKLGFQSQINERLTEWLWVLDPLDGTKDFIQGTGNYAMHLALNHNQKPYLGVVLIPEKDELWITDGKTLRCEKSDGSQKNILSPKDKNINEMIIVCSKNHTNKILENVIEKINFKKKIVMGSIGCKIASIIRGDSDIYVSLSLPGKSSPKDWDLAAPEAILKAAGGAITNMDNEDLTYNNQNFEHKGIIIATNNRKTHERTCKKIKYIINKFDLFPINS